MSNFNSSFFESEKGCRRFCLRQPDFVMPDKNNTNLAKTPLFMRFFANSRMVYVQYYRPRLCNKSSKISAFLLHASLTACSRTEINLNKPQSRCFCPFRQNLARRIDIRLRSPLLKIIKNGGFEVASEFNGKKR